MPVDNHGSSPQVGFKLESSTLEKIDPFFDVETKHLKGFLCFVFSSWILPDINHGISL